MLIQRAGPKDRFTSDILLRDFSSTTARAMHTISYGVITSIEVNLVFLNSIYFYLMMSSHHFTIQVLDGYSYLVHSEEEGGQHLGKMADDASKHQHSNGLE